MSVLDLYAPKVMLIALLVLAVCIAVAFFRALIGPRTSDRIVAGNMIGSMTILLIAILTVMKKESWLVDVAIVYALLSFLAVVVYTRLDLGANRKWRRSQSDKENEEEDVTDA